MTDFGALIRLLAEGKVEFILVGGAAATAHGSARLTQDLDILYRRSADNIERLAACLVPHRPYLRDAAPGLPFRLDAETIQGGLNFTLTTGLGELDLFGEITGGGTYEDLIGDTIPIQLFGTTCRCLSLRKLIDVKRAAGRPRDLEAIAELEALREESEGGRHA
jgi:hypothetical protein